MNVSDSAFSSYNCALTSKDPLSSCESESVRPRNECKLSKRLLLCVEASSSGLGACEESAGWRVNPERVRWGELSDPARLDALLPGEEGAEGELDGGGGVAEEDRIESRRADVWLKQRRTGHELY